MEKKGGKRRRDREEKGGQKEKEKEREREEKVRAVSREGSSIFTMATTPLLPPRVRTSEDLSSYTHTRTRTRTHTHTHTRTRTPTRTHTHTHAHAHTLAHTHTHTHTHRACRKCERLMAFLWSAFIFLESRLYQVLYSSC